MVKVDGLQPCTQYTFTLYTKHMVGDKKKVIKEEKAITDVTKCPGRSNTRIKYGEMFQVDNSKLSS